MPALVFERQEKEKKAQAMILEGKNPPKPKKDDEEGDEEEEEEEKDEEIEMDEAGEDGASVAPLQSVPEQSPIQPIDDPHATMTDEEHAILIGETKDIYEDFEVGLKEVCKVNIDGAATSETLYVKFTDVFETRFSGCKDIKLMRYFKVFLRCLQNNFNRGRIRVNC